MPSSRLVAFFVALACGFLVGATLPRAHACSTAGPPFFSIVEVEGDATEVQRWQAFRDAGDVVVIESDHVRVDDGQFWKNYFLLLLGSAQ